MIDIDLIEREKVGSENFRNGIFTFVTVIDCSVKFDRAKA